MATNNKYNKIVNEIFKGDLGAESQIQNDSILALMLRQDAIVASMTTTQKTKYDGLILPYLGFTDRVKEEAINNYLAKMNLLGKPNVFDNIEKTIIDTNETK